jgi:alkylhydroperoxidase/carboxymuconolactone decarboxylase family protein YurZ
MVTPVSKDAVSKQQEVEKVKEHFMETLGNLPGAIRAMADYAPDVLLGYTQLRKAIYRTPAEGGALDLKTKELLYSIFDVIACNLDGAKNHYAAAHRHGVTLAEISEACMIAMHVFGVQTWGMAGYKLCDYAAELEKGGGATPKHP